MSVADTRPIPVRCPQGGYAPCVDDLCHGVDTTMCGLERGSDFCDHGYLPTTCQECSAGPEDW